nr:hypothetical protein CFP56_04260 [Quercus suber]
MSGLLHAGSRSWARVLPGVGSAARGSLSLRPHGHASTRRHPFMALFKRPAWAKTHSSEEGPEAEDSFFKHSSRSYQEIVAEEHRKRKEKAEKQKAILERKTSGDEQKENKERPRSPKRRRITLEEGADLLKSVGLGPVEISDDDGAEVLGSSSKLPVRRSPRINKTVEKVGVVGNADDEDDDIFRSKPPAREPELEEEDEDSDEDIAKLKRRARELRRVRDEQRRNTPTPDVGARPGEPGPATTSIPPLLDPPIKLLISSRLPNTQPLIVFRKLSQRLKEIRDVWCMKQGLSETQTQDVFLIHNMKRIYDVTTCKSLGLDVDRDGIVTMRGAEGMDELDKVHLEAVTEELFTQMKEHKTREERERRGLLRAGEIHGLGVREDQVVMKEPDEEQLVKIYLKAKNQEPYRLKVKPVSTTAIPVEPCYAELSLRRPRSSPRSSPPARRISPSRMTQKSGLSLTETDWIPQLKCIPPRSRTWIV